MHFKLTNDVTVIKKVRMAAYGYVFYLRVLNTRSRDKIRIHKRPCYILFII